MRGDCPMMSGAMGPGMMRRGRMMSCTRLSADEQGVYLLRGGKVTVFDHDLNRESSWRVATADGPANERMRRMAMEHMDRTRCPNCRMHSDMVVDGARRAIEGGSVEVWHRPRALSAGAARFHVQVLDADGAPDAEATVSLYLYPNDDPGRGASLAVQPLGAGQYYGVVEISGAGEWELAVRVIRPGMEDARVYYDLPVR